MAINLSLVKARPENQRFWVVRASGGRYVPHFRRGGVVAIGHLNKLHLQEGDVDERLLVGLDKALEKEFPDRTRGSITSHVNQVASLIAGMQPGDMVVTLDSEALMVGLVDGPPSVDRRPIVVEYSDGTDSAMPHILRRSVRWGPTLSRHEVPTALENTLFAHQTVFNVDEHWASIYHLLYPCFRFKDRLYLSANIQQPDQIHSYAVAQLFSALSGLEAVGSALAKSDSRSYDEIFASFAAEHRFALSTRAEFMSPGNVWSTVTMGTKAMAWTALIYVMLFGGDMKLIKADGVITKEMREKAWELVLEMSKRHDFDRVRDELRLQLPRVDTRALDDRDEKNA